MKNFLRLALTLAAGTGLTVSSAFASSIIVNNFSFEDIFGGSLPNACGPGCSYGVGLPVSGWSITGAGAGQFQPGPSPSPFFNSVPDGTVVAYADTSGTIISQTVAPLVQLDMTYTLQVDLGHRLDLPFTAGASLLVNGVAYAATGVAPASGDWSTYTVTYVGTAADVGSAITIQLESGGSQANFDNVQLTDSTNTPEPGIMGMLGAGLVALAFFARRK